MAKKIEAYKCEKCNSIWETKEDAVECEASHEKARRPITFEEFEASLQRLREAVGRYKTEVERS